MEHFLSVIKNIWIAQLGKPLTVRPGDKRKNTAYAQRVGCADAEELLTILDWGVAQGYVSRNGNSRAVSTFSSALRHLALDDPRIDATRFPRPVAGIPTSDEERVRLLCYIKSGQAFVLESELTSELAQDILGRPDSRALREKTTQWIAQGKLSVRTLSDNRGLSTVTFCLFPPALLDEAFPSWEYEQNDAAHDAVARTQPPEERKEQTMTKNGIAERMSPEVRLMQLYQAIGGRAVNPTTDLEHTGRIGNSGKQFLYDMTKDGWFKRLDDGTLEWRRVPSVSEDAPTDEKAKKPKRRERRAPKKKAAAQKRHASNRQLESLDQLEAQLAKIQEQRVTLDEQEAAMKENLKAMRVSDMRQRFDALDGDEQKAFFSTFKAKDLDRFNLYRVR